MTTQKISIIHYFSFCTHDSAAFSCSSKRKLKISIEHILIRRKVSIALIYPKVQCVFDNNNESYFLFSISQHAAVWCLEESLQNEWKGFWLLTGVKFIWFLLDWCINKVVFLKMKSEAYSPLFYLILVIL